MPIKREEILYDILKEILGDDVNDFLSDDRNMDVVVTVYSFGFKKGAEEARNAATETIREYIISKMKEGRNEQTAQ